MKNENVTKVNQIGKAGRIIANIAKVVISIGAIACLVSGLILMVLPDDMVVIHMDGKATVEINMPVTAEGMIVSEDGPTAVVVGDISGALEMNGVEYGVVGMTPTEKGVMVEAEADSYTLKFNQLTNTVFLAAINCAAIWVVMHFISKLCKLFEECETPFTEEIVQALKKLAIALIPMAFFSNMASSVTDSIMTGNVNIVIGVDMTTVLLVLLVFMLSAIFSYGTTLQQESDETL
ncbi:MAG: DUF2975 domain-containing protein [Roseburia sp.]|nr:DUF2975 domain-containing protein [Roseburia sp.]